MIEVTINNNDITRLLTGFGNLKQFNDETFHFSGVYRTGKLTISADNNSGIFNRNSRIFNGNRNLAQVQVFFVANDPALPKQKIWEGQLHESSTTNDITRRVISFTALEYLDSVYKLIIRRGDQARIDELYRSLRGSRDIRLNKHFLACFLYRFLIEKGDAFLSDVLQVFTGGFLQPGSYPTINAGIESIFPPADAYYTADNTPVENILKELCRSLNAYLVLDNGGRLHIKARPDARQTKKLINAADIIAITQQTDGLNKLYNQILINDSEPYNDQASQAKYGVKQLAVNSYAPASQALARSYLDYYAEPRAEVTLRLKMNLLTLSFQIGDTLTLNQNDLPGGATQAFKGDFYILSRELELEPETIKLRLRAI